jgi:hypothetical protein
MIQRRLIVHVPSKIIDISIALDNETVTDPEVMRPKIEYVSNKENAELMCSMFPGLKPSDLPTARRGHGRKSPLTRTTVPIWTPRTTFIPWTRGVSA